MAVSGHETFHIREGWLHKGLKMLVESPSTLTDEYVHDALGVGRNMGKSIKHWLGATGLSNSLPQKNSDKSLKMNPTDLGRLIYKKDPHFTAPGTWWALHVNLVQAKSVASTWTWFFDRYAQGRFERATCLDAYRRHLELTTKKLPSIKTLQRDVDCMLRSYAKNVPSDDLDPEEALDCPFSELGLLRYFKHSGYFQLNQEAKAIPFHVFGYSLAVAFSKLTTGSGSWDVSLADAARETGGPGKAFAMTGEVLFNAIQALENASEGQIEIAGMAGQRLIRCARKPAIKWLEEYYKSLGKKEINAA